MERQIGYVDVEEVKKVFYGNDSNEKIAYANMIERTMIGLDGKEEKNLEDIMNLLIECVIIEKDDDVKEAMFDGLRSMVGNNDSASINKQLEILINKLQVLEDRDLAESLLVISNTFDIRYLDLMEEYKDHPDEYVSEVAQESISDIKYKYKI